MILKYSLYLKLYKGIPRMSGDDPPLLIDFVPLFQYSPHERG